MISYTDITHASSTVKTPWIGETTHSQYKAYGGFHTGIDIVTDEVYSCESGVVIQTGKTNSDLYELTIQYDASISLRYMHLKNISIRAGDIIQKGDYIGKADKYVHFEYVSVNQEDSKWPVRVGTVTYYKHDPELLFSGQVLLNSNDWTRVTNVDIPYNTHYDINTNMKSEFESDNRGGH